MPLGETGEYPSGKLNEHDQVELLIAVAADKLNGKILLQFGKPVTWLGMDATQAHRLGEMLINKAAELPEISGAEWEKAINHFRAVRQVYQDLVSEPGCTTSPALEYIFRPLSKRYHRGERTKELYEAMLAVE